MALVEITLHHDAYSKTKICEILELSNEEELFSICQMTDHVKKYQHFELYKRAMHVFGEAKRVHDYKAVCDKEATEAGFGSFSLHKYLRKVRALILVRSEGFIKIPLLRQN